MAIRRSRTRADEVAELLTARIRSGALPVGEKLPTESALVEEAGVSRTVVREAISKLQAGGWVETRHGIGTFVLPAPRDGTTAPTVISVPTVLDVLAVLEVRISLETEAAGLAAQRRSEAHLKVMKRALKAFEDAITRPNDQAVNPDVTFHEEIAKATGNRYFLDMLRQLGQAIIPRTRVSVAEYAEDQKSYLRKVNLEHHKILDAIAAHDAAAARTAMRNHLSRSRARLQAVLDDAQ
jgi:DNA-binding FadR family transcriptional regulator